MGMATFTTKTIKSQEELSTQIQLSSPAIYLSSKTSTVIPFDKLDLFYKEYLGEITLCDLSNMPASLEILDDHTAKITGALNWSEARKILRARGYDIMVSPTEELALVLAGISTSATGEHSFGYGTLRDQVVEINYCDYQGKIKTLFAQRPLEVAGVDFSAYQKSYLPYEKFKNGPFPRFSKETDLLTGTEGQLGVIVSAKIKITKLKNTKHLFIKLPFWFDDDSVHLEILSKVQKWRGKILICELTDQNSYQFLSDENKLVDSGDLIFLEIDENYFEEVYEKFLTDLKGVSEDDIFEITHSKFHQIRASIPRSVNERNAMLGVIKKGTDVQVSVEKFPALLEIYRGFVKSGVTCNLFGHFGDCHLHFNFMPDATQAAGIDKLLEKFYLDLKMLNASPFAEHGVGLIKQRFIKNYYTSEQIHIFTALKKKFDPHRQFFPLGFMDL